MHLIESLAALAREWIQDAELWPGGPSAPHAERQAGKAQALRRCAQQLSLILASATPGSVVVPAEEWEALQRVAETGRRYLETTDTENACSRELCAFQDALRALSRIRAG